VFERRLLVRMPPLAGAPVRDAGCDLVGGRSVALRPRGDAASQPCGSMPPWLLSRGCGGLPHEAPGRRRTPRQVSG